MVTPQVWKGSVGTLKLGRAEAIVVAVPAGTAGKIKTQVVRPDPLVAPFKRGQSVGTLKVLAKNDLGDDVIASPAIADGRLYFRTKQKIMCFAEPE